MEKISAKKWEERVFPAFIYLINATIFGASIISTGLIIEDFQFSFPVLVYATIMFGIYAVMADHITAKLILFVPSIKTINFGLRKSRFG